MQDAQRKRDVAEAQLAETQGSLAALRRKSMAHDAEKRALAAMHDEWLDSLTQPCKPTLHKSPAAEVSAWGEQDTHTHAYELFE